ncbi:MAG: hypothetical protein HYS32_00410 [Candidatus Woesearchaeota archaeon]|nr:MAG: hypothetical protein HYS32_00410 [Candidatus Woesearchaeota archaeon]
MVDVEELRFHAPCGFGGKAGREQLLDRIVSGFVPSVILRDPLSEEDRRALIEVVTEGGVKDVAFDMGELKEKEGDVEDSFRYYSGILAFLGRLVAEKPGHFSRGVGVKFGSATGYDRPKFSNSSPLTLAEFLAARERNLGLMRRVNEFALAQGLHLEVENRPEPNFLYDKKGIRGGGDPHPRWGNTWLATPIFMGSFMSIGALDILDTVRCLPGSKLQLDLEHLCQVTAHGNIFNLDMATKEVLKFGDLSGGQKWALRQYYPNIADEEVLFNFSGLTGDEERSFVERGFAVRQGEPIVYESGVTLSGELDTLFGEVAARRLVISSLTPGFQAHQGVRDIVDGRDVLTICSHLPGIVPRYIRHERLRDLLTRQVRNIHLSVGQKIRTLFGAGHSLDGEGKSRVLNLELEIQPDAEVGDGTTKVIYSGPQWREQAAEARRQLTDNFRLALSSGPHDLSGGPYYL